MPKMRKLAKIQDLGDIGIDLKVRPFEKKIIDSLMKHIQFFRK